MKEFKKIENKKDIVFIFDDYYLYRNNKSYGFNFNGGKYVVYNYSMNMFFTVNNAKIFGFCFSYYNRYGAYFNGMNGKIKKNK
jgi:hypothetical protein